MLCLLQAQQGPLHQSVLLLQAQGCTPTIYAAMLLHSAAATELANMKLVRRCKHNA
jgi:hypothetical protein